MPALVPAGEAVPVSLEARDVNNTLVTDFNGEVTLRQLSPGPKPTLLLTEVETITAKRVEITNTSTNAASVGGWRVVFFDSESWPWPKTLFALPPGTVCPGRGVFEVRSEGVAPGACPVFYTGVKLSWRTSSINNPEAVALVDDAGNVVDFFCAADAYPALLRLPFGQTTTPWAGLPVPAILNSSLTHQRTGHADHNCAADWISAAGTVGVLNSGLQLPPAAPSVLTPLIPDRVSFTGGKWSGLVKSASPATNAVWRADDLAGHAGDSTPLTITGWPPLGLQLPLTTHEATPGFAGDGIITLRQPIASNIVVALTSSLTNLIRVPPAVSISAGATRASFAVTNLDDGFIKGPQSVAVVASADGFQSATTWVTNYDLPLALSLTVPADLLETAGWVRNAKVGIPGSAAADVVVRLESGNPTRVWVPDYCVIQSGQSSAPFSIGALDNALLDGNEDVTITASVTGWTNAEAQLRIRDDESPRLWLALSSYAVQEGSRWLSNYATLEILGTVPTNLPIALTTEAPAKLQIPATVLIPAGQTQTTFDVYVPEDPAAEPNQAVTITATAPGFAPSSRTITILDDHLAGFQLSSLPPAQVAGQPFEITVQAMNRSGSILPGYVGTLQLAAKGSAGAATVFPPSIGPFTNGAWTGAVTIPEATRGLVLTADDGAGHSVSTAPFDVVADRILALSAADLAYDALRKQLLAGVVESPGVTAQCLIPIDPPTGSLLPSIPLGADPEKLALSDDFTYLYAAMANSSTGGVARVDLNSRTVDMRFPLGTLNMYGQAVNWVKDMKVQPGHPHTLLATARILYGYDQYIAVYDDGVMRPETVTPVYYVSPYHITFADSPSWFYITKPNGLWINSITPDGAHFLQEIQGPQYGAEMLFAGGNLYSVTGDVFTTNNFALAGSFGASGSVIPDLPNGRVYFLTHDSTKTTFVAFDRTTFRKIADLAMPGVSGQAGSFVQCGPSIFAFQTTSGQIHIVDTSMLFTNLNADLSISVAAAPARPVAEDNLTYSVTISNAGPATSYGVTLTCQIPALSTFVSAGPSLGTSTNNGAVVCALGDLASDTATTVNVVVRVNTGGSIAASFSADAATVDRNQADNRVVDSRSARVLGDVAPVSPLSLSANHLVFDPATQKIFLTVPPASTGLSNCLVNLDPFTGELGTPLFVGREPNRMAIASGGRYLYIGVDGDHAVRRYDTVSQTLYPPFSVGENTVATEMSVRPGAPETLAVSHYVPLAWALTDVALYDNGVPRPARVHSPHVEFSADGSILYGSGWDGTSWPNVGSDDFYVNQVTAEGLTNVSAVPLPFVSNAAMQMANGQAYYDFGFVFDPVSHTSLNPAFVGIAYASIVRVDPEEDRVFFVFSDSQNWFLQQFNMATHALEASRILPPLAADPRDLIRWGTSGLAFRNDAGQLFLVRIPALPKVPQVAVAQNVSPAVGTVGRALAYSLAVTNFGAADATNVVLTDVLPAGALFLDASSSQGTVTQYEGNVVFSLGGLSHGASATATIHLTPQVAGWNVNDSSVVADLYDLSSGTNRLTLSTWVNIGSAQSTTNLVLVPGLSSLAYDPSRQVIYGGVNSSGGAFSNSIIGLDARTGALVSQLSLGDLPGRMALSDDSHHLYIGLSSTGGVARVNLWSNSVDLRFALGVNDRFGFYGAGDLKVVPGQPEALAVSINHGQSNEGIQIFDNGVPRPAASPGSTYGGVYWIAFGASPSVLYSAFPFAFRTITVDANGATLVSEDGGLVPAYDNYFEYDSGRVYFQTGRIIDPVAKTITGQLPIGGLVSPDAAAGRAYCVSLAGYAPFNYQLTLRGFDLGTLNELWSVPFPVASGSALQSLKCGTNGVAVLTDAGKLFVVRTAGLVTPNADLSVSQTAPANGTAGAALPMVFTIRNSGPWTASEVLVSNPVPSSAIFVSASASQGSCLYTNGSVVASLGLLTNGSSATVTVTYTVPTGGPLTNFITAWHSGIDENPANNSDLGLVNVAAQPVLFVGSTNVLQTGGLNGPIVFSYALSNPSSVPVSVNYQTSDGTAVAGLDYTPAAGVLTLSPGRTSGSLFLNIIRPSVSSKASKFFYLNLFSPTNASLVSSQAVGTIITRNYRTISAVDAKVVEGDTGVTTAQFTLSLNSLSADPVSVQYQTIGGTAAAMTDFQPVSGSLVIPAGKTNVNVSVPVFGDVLWEPDETFFLVLSEPENAVLAVPEAVGTILNDDPFPSLTARSIRGDLVLEWVGGPYLLQVSTNVAGPFLDLPDSSSPFTNKVGSQEKSFFRLQIP